MDIRGPATLTKPRDNSNNFSGEQGERNTRLFKSIENTPVGQESAEQINERIERIRLEHQRQRTVQNRIFENQRTVLQQNQRQEGAIMMQDQQQRQSTTPSRPGADEQAARLSAANDSGNAASAPTTPPYGSKNFPPPHRNVPLSPQGLTSLNEENNRRPPEEGLNGSNVPGLAPHQPPRSVPSSRRTSGPPEEMTSADQQLLAANRRSINGSVGDLTNAFDRITVGSAVKTGMRGSPLGHTPPTPSSGAGVGVSPHSTGSGPQSALQRAMNRSNMESSHSNGAIANESGLTPVFNERFLFDDDELEADDSAFVRKYNLNEDDNSFPVLIRRDSHPGMLSASSAALDLAPLSQTPPRFPRSSGESPGANSNVSEWPQFAGRNGEAIRPANVTTDRFDRFSGDRRGRSERNSPRLPTDQATGGRGMHMTTAPGTPNSSGRQSGGSNDSHLPKSASAARFAGQPPHRLSQGFNEREVEEEIRREQQRQQQQQQQREQQQQLGKDGGPARNDGFPSFAIDSFSNEGANVRANAGAAAPPARSFAPYGPGFDNRASSADYSRSPSGYFEAFASPASNAASAKQASNFAPGPPSAFGPLGVADVGGAAGGLGGIKTPRKGELDSNTPLDELQGEIFALCKDQHGCRYLQKKLEEGIPSYRDIIFTETFSHFAELMTDPFGNYLCQKMLEYCTDEQRNLIVESVAPDLVGISLNMHGTRAVQKTIDFLSTNRQIHSIIVALSMNVVTLIKDLNGNHVVQKCLNRLGAEDNQFIYNAVAAHCVEVATHRHGCCVLQRCIDHASDSQRMQLVQEITYNALTLVQDPFGNYVVQYILDLNDARFSDAVIRQFVGSVCLLSVQKFSSNVIEKCIRVSEVGLRKQLIEELLNRTRLEKLLRDSFANYVVQTSLDYADPVQRMQLVECIKPILPMIRNTPYGKRIQSKLQRDNIDMGGAPPSNVPYSLLQAAHQHQLQAMAAIARQGGGGGGVGAGNGAGAEGYPSMGPYNTAAHGAMNHQPGGNRFARPSMAGGSPLPPPNMYASPGLTPGRPYPQQAGGAPPPPANLYGGFNRGASNHAAGAPLGYPSQQGYPMQGGFGAAIPSHHGNGPYQNNYAPF